MARLMARVVAVRSPGRIAAAAAILWAVACQWGALGARPGTTGPVSAHPPGARSAPTAPVPTSTPASRDSWVSLRAPGSGRVAAVAVAPDWPGDPLILLARASPSPEGQFFRNRDGGATWERLAPSASDLRFEESSWGYLRLAPLAGGGLVGFALVDPRGPRGWTLLRSTDEGDTWSVIFEVAAGGIAPGLALSPDFARDGTAYLLSGGSLLRSVDAGATWYEGRPAPSWPPGGPADQTAGPMQGQGVRQVRFSPAYAQDRTMLLAAGVVPPPAEVPSAGATGAMDAHERSLGVLASDDGGQTWTQASAGLEIGGTPYRDVRALTFSPTFAGDGTVFAFAWGPPQRFPDRQGVIWRRALFRSADRGASWQPVLPLDLLPRPVWIDLALSPAFAADGTAIAALLFSGGSPASSGCSVRVTSDGGATWRRGPERMTYASCLGVRALATRSGPVVLVQFEATWLRSDDGGRSWRSFSLRPDGSPAVSYVGEPLPGPGAALIAADSSGEVWLVSFDP